MNESIAQEESPAILRAKKLFEAYGEDAEHIAPSVVHDLVNDVIEFCRFKGISLNIAQA
jgi:hypothetical protein